MISYAKKRNNNTTLSFYILAVCTPMCLNNGFCRGRDGKAVCICPERNFTGEQCEICKFSYYVTSINLRG